jgi:hypothetical protein
VLVLRAPVLRCRRPAVVGLLDVAQQHALAFAVELDEPRDEPQFPDAGVVVSAQPHDLGERRRAERGTDGAAIVADLIVAFTHRALGVLSRELAGFVGLAGGSLRA